jgi:hypothetical protein
LNDEAAKKEGRARFKTEKSENVQQMRERSGLTTLLL